MKVLLSLSVLCITLALCQAYCFQQAPELVNRNGVPVPQDSCIDLFDGNSHPVGSKWNTDKCLECTCAAGGMTCCARHGGIAVGPPGCKAVVNPETCRYEFYHFDNPLEPCP